MGDRRVFFLFLLEFLVSRQRDIGAGFKKLFPKL